MWNGILDCIHEAPQLSQTCLQAAVASRAWTSGCLTLWMALQTTMH